MLLSIIIPIYNAAPYLNKCLSSITKQIDDSAELICIDDGSTDGSSEICKMFAKNNAYIKVIHKANGGVSSARNLGLEKAIGKYIAWVDADDYVADDWYASIKLELLKNPDVVYFDHIRVEADNYVLVSYGGEARQLDQIDFLKELTLDDKVKSYLWAQVVRTTLFTKIKFSTTKSLMEDYDILHKVLYRAKKINYLAKPLYFYFIRENSISHTIDFQNYFQATIIAKDRYEWLTDRGVNVSKVGYLRHNLLFLVALARENHYVEWINEANICRKEIGENIGLLLTSTNVSIKDKIKYFLIKTNKLQIIYRFLRLVKSSN